MAPFVKKIFCLTILALSILVTSCDNRPSPDKRLSRALQIGDTNLVAQYLDSGLGDVNQTIQYEPFERVRAPLLDIAVEYGQTNMIRMLLSRGAYPNQMDPKGDTAVMWAITGGIDVVPLKTRLEILLMLLEAKGDPNLHNLGPFWTPLCKAADFQQPEMVKILISFGADVNATNYEGLTALNFAASPEIASVVFIK